MKKTDLISEYLGSNIARLIIGEQAPLVIILKDHEGNIYTASKFIKDFQTFITYLPDLSLNLGTLPAINDLEKINMVMEFVNHNDAHYNNLGVIANDTIIQASVVDFSRSLQEQTNLIRYYNNHNNKKTISILQYITSIPQKQLDSLLEKLFHNLKIYYTHEIEQKLLDCWQARTQDFLVHRQELLRTEKTLLELNQAIQEKIVSHLNYFQSMLPSIPLVSFQDETLSNTIGLLANSDEFYNESNVIFRHLLSFIKNNNNSMKITIHNIINYNNQHMLEMIFPHMKDSPEYLKEALGTAVYNNNLNMFEMIFSHMKDSPEYLEEALGTSVFFANNLNIFNHFNESFKMIKYNISYLEPKCHVSITGIIDDALIENL